MFPRQESLDLIQRRPRLVLGGDGDALKHEPVQGGEDEPGQIELRHPLQPDIVLSVVWAPVPYPGFRSSDRSI